MSAKNSSIVAISIVLIAVFGVAVTLSHAQEERRRLSEKDVPYPPTLPGGETIVTDTSPDFLKPPASLKEGVAVAKTPPSIDFMYYPGQDYIGKPWSNWGDSVAANGKYYSAIGDHLAIGVKEGGDAGEGPRRTGNAFLYEYDPEAKVFRLLADMQEVLKLPDGHYTPGKIHSRIDLGSDGWLYYATHRGSERAAADAFHYKGDWILRTNPKSGETEVVAQGPVHKHSMPTSVLDPDRLIFYAGTAPGPDAAEKGIQFLAYDLKNKKVLYSGPDGPARYMIFARSTGRVYFVPGKAEGELMRFDPATGGAPEKVGSATPGIRAATEETPDGFVYAVSSGQGKNDATIWSLNTRTEEVKELGPAAIGTEAYITSIDADPTGRYLYYVPGAHGSGPRDGSPIIQFDVKSGQKKVIAFLHPYYEQKYNLILTGTYATAVDPAGDKLYITWNVSRGTRAWDSCGLTVVHIPESERQP